MSTKTTAAKAQGGTWPKGYRKRLEQFNSSPKYRKEMELLRMVMDVRLHENVLDYGCGLGTMVKYLQAKSEGKIYGYDIYNWLPGAEEPFWWRQSFYFQFDKVFFMHSLAHLPDPYDAINMLRSQFLKEKSKVYVVTPNADWMALQENSSYIPDPTVVDHFNPERLQELFARAGFKVELLAQFGAIAGGKNERILMVAST